MTRIKIPDTTPREPNRPELLTMPPIPSCLLGLNPRTLMGRTLWDATRNAVYRSNRWCCAACGVHASQAWLNKWMEAHEVYKYNTETQLAYLVDIVPLCTRCHAFVHMEITVSNPAYSKLDKKYIAESGWMLAKDHMPLTPGQYYALPSDLRAEHDKLYSRPYSNPLEIYSWSLVWETLHWQMSMGRVYVRRDESSTWHRAIRDNERFVHP